MNKNNCLTIAIAKGRITKESLPLLKKMGIEPIKLIEKTRQLLINTNNKNIKLIIVRTSDVPVYVHHGIADIGIVGKDTLLEQQNLNYYELLDLNFCHCKLQLAGLPNTNIDNTPYLKIATKFVHATKQWFAKKRKQVQIIKLNGAIELAATSGLAHGIVDLVDTGNTLKANGLIPYETIFESSVHLIANSISYKKRSDEFENLIKQFKTL